MRILLTAIGLWTAACADMAVAAEKPRNKALERGIAWLLTQQGPDGAWRSETYGQMKCGIGNTAMAVYALSQLDKRTAVERNAMEHGLEYLCGNLDPQGFCRAPDGESDYPNYATALAVDVIIRCRVEGYTRDRKRMVEFLIASQNLRDTVETNPEFGGWTHTGSDRLDSPIRGETNMSVTRFTLQALSSAGRLESRTRIAALNFLLNCQNPADTPGDGGFFFTTTRDDPRNKAGWVTKGKANYPRSYGTTTADGICALHACRIHVEDPRMLNAINWLDKRPGVDHVPGFVDGTPSETYRDGLLFYYRASLAEAMQIAPDSSFAKQRQQIIDQLAGSQRTDGWWKNPNTQMREDDPLIATPLAITALAKLLQSVAPSL